MSLDERITWMEKMMVLTGCSCFHNILGVIDFFKSENLGASGSWISLVDSAILQGISLGYGNFLASKGQGSLMKNANWGKDDWTTFFQYREAKPGDVAGQTNLWGRAEQAATDYGVWYAKNGINPKTGNTYNLQPSGKESGLIAATNIYRGAVMQPGASLFSIFNPYNPGLRGIVKSLAVAYWETASAVGVQ